MTDIIDAMVAAFRESEDFGRWLTANTQDAQDAYMRDRMLAVLRTVDRLRASALANPEPFDARQEYPHA